LNKRSMNGDTALHLACSKGALTVVRILVKNGANTNIENVNGQTPLDVARGAGNSEMIDCLAIEFPHIEFTRGSNCPCQVACADY